MCNGCLIINNSNGIENLPFAQDEISLRVGTRASVFVGDFNTIRCCY